MCVRGALDPSYSSGRTLLRVFEAECTALPRGKVPSPNYQAGATTFKNTVWDLVPWDLGPCFLVPHFIITLTFADGACEARSRQGEEVDAWPSSTTTNAEIVHNLHLPYGWRRDGPMALSLLLPIHKGMASSSLRVPAALATNVSVIMKWGT